MRRGKRIVNLKVLPGEPTDGSGKVCIHLFVIDEKGPFVEPSVTQMVDAEDGSKRLGVKAARGRLACDRKRTVAPVVHNGSMAVTLRSGDPRAVTCLKCKASPDFIKGMELIAAAEAGR